MQKTDEDYLTQIRADNASYVATYGESRGYQYSLDMNQRIAFLLKQLDDLRESMVERVMDLPLTDPAMQAWMNKPLPPYGSGTVGVALSKREGSDADPEIEECQS